MIPIRDTIQSRNYPVINSAIIVTNCLIYLVQLAQGDRLRQFILTYGLIPARYSVPEIGSQFTLGQQIFCLLSFMFLHGGFWHLLGNMWSLYIFGDNVEDRLGPLKYLLFYLLCGFASGLSHLFINWHSELPTVGASGAIAGVMGAYFLLYPSSRILTLIPIFFLPYFIEIPAYFFLGVWFLLQFMSAAAGPAQGGGGIAWWAHIGGFVFGMVSVKLFLRIPELGISGRIRQKTSKRKTHRLQVIKPTAPTKQHGAVKDPHLYGTVAITPREAELGTRKLVNITTGKRKRLFRVTIPPGSREGALLRLAGVGQQLDDGTRGNVYLRILIG
jgi:membrane associated rhomboid family serine protease